MAQADDFYIYGGIEMDFTSLGKKLQDARQKHQITQAQVAKFCNVSRNYVSAMERGVNMPSAKILIQYAELCKTTVDDIINPGQTIIPELKEELINMNIVDQKKILEIIKILKR